MNLAAQYARVAPHVDTKKFVAYLKKRGHLQLLPQVVRLLERERPVTDVVVVSEEADVQEFTKKFPGARIVVDPKIVGGYAVTGKGKVVDRTYRTALVNLYQKITS